MDGSGTAGAYRLDMFHRRTLRWLFLMMIGHLEIIGFLAKRFDLQDATYSGKKDGWV